jgi:hypothetical protein
VRLALRLAIAAPVDKVWRALTDPDQVTAWAGVQPVRLQPDYPVAGEHALWREADGTLLHDEILIVVPERRLQSRLRRGPALVLEDYVLCPAGRAGTTLRAEWRGHPALVTGNDAAMARMIRALGVGVRHGE